MYKIEIIDKAQNELMNSVAWYEDQQEGTGLKFIQAIQESYQLISGKAKSFKLVKGKFRECFLKRFQFFIAQEAQRENSNSSSNNITKAQHFEFLSSYI